MLKRFNKTLSSAGSFKLFNSELSRTLHDDQARRSTFWASSMIPTSLSATAHYNR